MSDKTFGVRSGMIQFDPKRDRTVNGQAVTDVTIKLDGSDTLVSITIWPEFVTPAGQALKDIVKKGDWLSADGALESRVGQDGSGAPRTYYSISATSIAYVGGIVKPPRQVVQAPAQQGFVVPVAAPVQAAPVQAVAAAPVAAPIPAAETSQAIPATAPAPF